MNAAYRTETEAEQEELYLSTVKENVREEIFANIDWVDSGGDKHKIKMKVDTRAKHNSTENLQKNVPMRHQQQNGKLTSIRREVTTIWAINGMKILQ